MASIISGAINSAAWTGAGIIPMFVVGLAYLRYSLYDPESRVIDVQEVRAIRVVHREVLKPLYKTIFYDLIHLYT